MVSATADYALRALLLLARSDDKQAISADSIAKAIGAPRNYTAKVLSAVAKVGLISSARGPAGGFALAVPATEITLGRIVDLFDPAPPHPRCVLGSGLCDPTRPCSAHRAWQAVARVGRAPMATTTLADLIAGRVAQLNHNFSEDSFHAG